MSSVTSEQNISIQGSEPRSPAERRKRGLFLGYLDALWNPKEMESRFAPDFWPHDVIPGDQRPPVGVGTQAMRGFRETINSAFTTVRSMEATWIEDDTELSEVAGVLTRVTWWAPAWSSRMFTTAARLRSPASQWASMP